MTIEATKSLSLDRLFRGNCSKHVAMVTEDKSVGTIDSEETVE